MKIYKNAKDGYQVKPTPTCKNWGKGSQITRTMKAAIICQVGHS